MHFSTFVSSCLLLAASSSVLASPAPQMLAGESASPAPAAVSESVAAAGVAGATPAANSSGGAIAAGTSTAAAAGSTSSGVIGGSSGGNLPVWVIKVGSPNNDLVFSPNSLAAKPGDMVQFQFYSKNHSVASTTFDNPCVPEMQSNPAATNAFWSGFMPTEQQGEFVFTMMVKDTNPVYFYCTQGMHCQSGMVGVINPPTSGNTLDAFTQKAMQAPANISPNSGSTSAGTIGGTSSTTGSATAASATKAAASNVRIASWWLVASTVAAVLLL